MALPFNAFDGRREGEIIIADCNIPNSGGQATTHFQEVPLRSKGNLPKASIKRNLPTALDHTKSPSFPHLCCFHVDKLTLWVKDDMPGGERFNRIIDEVNSV